MNSVAERQEAGPFGQQGQDQFGSKRLPEMKSTFDPPPTIFHADLLLAVV